MKYLLIFAIFTIATSAFSSSFMAASQSPLLMLQIAENHMQNVIETNLAPEWQDAEIGDVTPLYRSDMDKPAYFEYSVYVASEAAGFIVVSTGPHDFMVPHWSTKGMSPSHQIAAQYGKTNISKFFKEDVFAYGATTLSGDLIGIQASQLLKEQNFRQPYEESLAELAAPQWKEFNERQIGSTFTENDYVIVNTPAPSPQIRSDFFWDWP